jgi:DNA polymerase II small subunit/DNA polymerase delta subunit B
MYKYEKELIKIVESVGDGRTIADLSEKSFRNREFESFEAHEIYDIARGSSHFRYDERTQKVYLVKNS